MPEIYETPYKKYCEPDYDLYYLDTDEETKLPMKLFLHIKKDEISKKIPDYYKYLYEMNHEVYHLSDSVIYRINDTRHPCPPKKTYKQHGHVFMIKIDAATIRDAKPFKYVRN